MSKALTRDDVEAAVWKLSGWRVDQRELDDLLDLVDRYAGQSDGLVPAVSEQPDAGHLVLGDLPAEEQQRITQERLQSYEKGRTDTLRLWNEATEARRLQYEERIAAAFEEGRLSVPVPEPHTCIDPATVGEQLKAAFEAGRTEGQAETAERPPEGLPEFPATITPGQTFWAPDGGVWLSLGVPLGDAARTVIERECKTCFAVKPLAAFRKDSSGRLNHRRTCIGCENAERSIHRRNQKEGKKQA